MDETIYPTSTLPPLLVIKSSIYRIENKIKQLKRNHHHDDIVIIKNEPFITEQVEKQCTTNGEKNHPSPRPVASNDILHKATNNENFDSGVVKTVNKALAFE